MPHTFDPKDQKLNAPSFNKLIEPIKDLLVAAPLLVSRGNRPLQMDFDHQLKALIYFHLEEHSSGRALIQALNEDDFAREQVAPPDGIMKSSFSEAINSRGLEQLQYIYQGLRAKAPNLLPHKYAELGELVSIDGSLIDAVFSMTWADYRDGSKKAKVHLGFDINHSIPSKIYLTDGKADERPFVSQILSAGQTGVMDRYYQCHKDFDLWQSEGKHFVCRIKASTRTSVVTENAIPINSIIFYDAIVLLGTPRVNQTRKTVRLVGFQIDNVRYWVATDRFDLTAEQITLIYKLRWDIEKFFGWWKRHLRVYHLIARSKYGLMVQVLAGLITYMLLAIYCHEHHAEKVSIRRVRELRNKIKNETRDVGRSLSPIQNVKEQYEAFSNAKT